MATNINPQGSAQSLTDPLMGIIDKLFQSNTTGIPIAEGFELPTGSRGASIFPGGFDFLQPSTFFSRQATARSGGTPREFDPRVMGAFQDFNRRNTLLDSIVRMFSGGGGMFGLPSREDLLNPRLQDIEGERSRAAEQISQTAVSQGRNVSATPFARALAELTGRSTQERQRATGDVDTLLAQLGISQQGLLMQLLASMLGGR